MAVQVKTIRTITDDLTGAKGASPVQFGFDGKTYKIDLTEGNRRSLERSLRRYITVAREEKHADQVIARSNVRAWARENGFSIGDKGRIAADVMDAYLMANPQQTVDEDDDVTTDI